MKGQLPACIASDDHIVFGAKMDQTYITCEWPASVVELDRWRGLEKVRFPSLVACRIDAPDAPAALSARVYPLCNPA
jgi:hypothetical protein